MARTGHAPPKPRSNPSRRRLINTRLKNQGLSKHELVAVDIGPQPALRVLAPTIGARDLAAGSLDGKRVAAFVPLDNEFRRGKIIVWDVASGHQVAQITGLSGRSMAASGLALDATGQRAFLTGYPERGTAQPFQRQVSVWSLPDGTKQPQPFYVDSNWLNVLPLGVGSDTPLALADSGVVALMVPGDTEPVPLQRIARPDLPTIDAPRQARHTRKWAKQMCSMLVSDVEPDGASRNFPPGAYTGPLCS